MTNDTTAKALHEQQYCIQLLDQISAVHESVTSLGRGERHSLHRPHLDNVRLLQLRLHAHVAEFEAMKCSVPRAYRDVLPEGPRSSSADFFDYALTRDREIVTQVGRELLKLSKRNLEWSDRLTGLVMQFQHLGYDLLDTKMTINGPDSGWLQRLESLQSASGWLRRLESLDTYDFFNSAVDVRLNKAEGVVTIWYPRALHEELVRYLSVDGLGCDYVVSGISPLIPGYKDAIDVQHAQSVRAAYLAERKGGAREFAGP